MDLNFRFDVYHSRKVKITRSWRKSKILKSYVKISAPAVGRTISEIGLGARLKLYIS